MNVDITGDIRLLDSQVNRYCMILESGINVNENYYLTGDQLFVEDGNKGTSIFSSIVNAIKSFIERCRKKLSKLFGANKSKVERIEEGIKNNPEAAKKKFKIKFWEKEQKELDKNEKDLADMFYKVKEGTATDEEIAALEERCNQNFFNPALAAGVTALTAAAVVGVPKLINMVKQKKADNTDLDEEYVKEPRLKILYQPSLINDNKTALTDDQIAKFSKLYKCVKNTAQQKQQIVLDIEKAVTKALDEEIHILYGEAEAAADTAAAIAGEGNSAFKSRKKQQKEVDKFTQKSADIRQQREDYKNGNHDTGDIKDRVRNRKALAREIKADKQKSLDYAKRNENWRETVNRKGTEAIDKATFWRSDSRYERQEQNAEKKRARNRKKQYGSGY